MQKTTYNKVLNILEAMETKVYKLKGDIIEYTQDGIDENPFKTKHLIQMTSLLDQHAIRYLVIGDNSLSVIEK